MTIKVFTENNEQTNKCEVNFNVDIEFEIGYSPYTHIGNLKLKESSCSS